MDLNILIAFFLGICAAVMFCCIVIVVISFYNLSRLRKEQKRREKQMDHIELLINKLEND